MRTLNRPPYRDHVGPGCYNISSHSVGGVLKLGGSGGLASKTSRFKTTYGRRVPGPGAYNLPDMSRPPTVKMVTPKHCSSPTHTSVGPGSYDPKVPARTVSCAMTWSRSTSKRFAQPLPAQSPGPGEYTIPPPPLQSQAPRFVLPIDHDRVTVFGVGEGLQPMPLMLAQDMHLSTSFTTPGPGDCAGSGCAKRLLVLLNQVIAQLTDLADTLGS